MDNSSSQSTGHSGDVKKREGPAARGPKAKAARRKAILERRERQAKAARSLAVADRREREASEARAAKFAVTAATALPASRKPRHTLAIVSFCALVLLPIAVSIWYLWANAADQYASSMGFTVRQEEVASPVDILGGLTSLSGAGSTDTDILYSFIQSQQLVRLVDDRLDLRTLYSGPNDHDPIFTLDADTTIEDLVTFWRRMVQISYDQGSGIMEVRTLAFSPQDAQLIGQTILDESSRMINALSDTAREDSTRYAREDLDQAVIRLKEAREAITRFRSRTQIVDPNADLQGQMGLLNTLQQQLAEALIELDLLRDTTREGDPRIAQGERRIGVIRSRIEEERNKFSVGGEGPGGEDYATLVAEFERLSVDREFAEAAYTGALSAFDLARAEAQRQSRYLATYVEPTLSEKSEYPQRFILLGLVALFVLMIWSILTLVYYSLRDRR